MLIKISNFNFYLLRITYFLFIFFVFFPYIQFIPFGTDVQPYALLLGIFIFLFSKAVKVSRTDFLIIYILIASFFILFLNEINFNSFRSLLNYFSIFFISVSAYQVLNSNLLNIEKLIKFFFKIWVVVGIIQNFVFSNFMTFLISSSRTAHGRGVTSLAPEPTFFGIVLIFFIVFFLHFEKSKENKYYIIVSVISIFLLAKSAMAFIFLILLGFYFLLFNFRFKYLIFIIPLFFSVSFLFLFLRDTRIYKVLSLLFDNPKLLVLMDASVNDRFFHIYFSILGSINNFFLPNGFNMWEEFVSSMLVEYEEFIIIEWFSQGGRIMSGYGGMFFELGFLGFLVPFVFSFLLYRIYKSNLKSFFLHSFFINTIMFSAITVGFPIFCFYLGFLKHLYNKEK
jgi:hypothetical protein